MPQISVVIPTHNRQQTIARAINSVLKQTYPVAEIIVVDDASSDETAAVVRALESKKIKYIQMDRNRGGAVARNLGINAANGDWIAFLDSDDEWLPSKLYRQLAGFEEQNSSVILCCNATVIGMRENRIYNDRGPVELEQIDEYFLCTGNSFITSGLVVPTSDAKRTLFDERLRRHQDWDFVLRLLAGGLAYQYLHEPLVIYHDDHQITRVSKSVDVTPTLLWFSVSKNLSPKSRMWLYFSRYFLSDLRKRGVVAFWTGARLAFSNPIAALGMISKARRHLARNIWSSH